MPDPARNPKRVAVVDIGKTNAKLVLIDRASGTQIAALSRVNDVIDAGPYPHADTDGLWRFIVDGLAELHAAHGIEGISVTTHGATAALMAGDDLALPVLDYEHDGPEALAEDYARVRPDFAESLSPRLPNGLNLGAQIFWQAKRFPEAFARCDAILMYPQYWAFRLTGIKASETTSLGCHTDLWQPVRGDFSSLVVNEGWLGRFPPLAPAASVLGPVQAEIAAETGLDPATPVACGIHDSNASLVPYLRALTPPFTVISSGTWTIAMTVGGAADRLDRDRDSLANADLFGRAVPTARFMGGREYGILAGDDAPAPTEEDIAGIVARGIFAVPPFVPGVGPYPAGEGRWAGADAEMLSSSERAAAASLYLALMTRTSLELAGLGDTIVVEGPLARNIIYCRLLAGLTGSTVQASADATGTATGAAMLFDDFGNAGGPELAGTTVAPFMPGGLADYAERWTLLADGA